MQKKITLLIALSLVALMPMNVSASQPDYRQKKALVEDMMQRNRWGDARFMLDRMASEVDVQESRYSMEWIDFQRIQCDVELGVADVDEMMLRYVEMYPQSRYNNGVLYMLGSYYCDMDDFERAEKIFERVEYKHLEAHQKERFDIRMGYIHFVNERYNDAQIYFSRVKPISEYYRHALYCSSYIAYINEDYDFAEQGFKKLVEFDDYNELVPYYLLR